MPCVVDDGTVLPQLLANCDVLVDLALPSDKNIAALRRKLITRAEQLHRFLRPAASLAYASTMSVFHLDRFGPRFTTYGKTKLRAARTHRRLRKNTGHNIFGLRYGQVHGLVQSSSQGNVDPLVGSKKTVAPDILSFTAFVLSIAEAVALIVAGKAYAGTYTLISERAWSWHNVMNWWACDGGADVRVHTYSVKSPPSAIARSLPPFRKSLTRRGDHHRERLATYLWYVPPRLAELLIANRYLGIARQQMAAYQDHLVPKPIAQFVSVPGVRLARLSDSGQAMPPRHGALKAALKSITN